MGVSDPDWGILLRGIHSDRSWKHRISDQEAEWVLWRAAGLQEGVQLSRIVALAG